MTTIQQRILNALKSDQELTDLVLNITHDVIDDYNITQGKHVSIEDLDLDYTVTIPTRYGHIDAMRFDFYEDPCDRTFCDLMGSITDLFGEDKLEDLAYLVLHVCDAEFTDFIRDHYKSTDFDI